MLATMPTLPAHGQNLKTVLVVQVHVHGAHDLGVMAVLNLSSLAARPGV
jgi:hypothetical protein